MNRWLGSKLKFHIVKELNKEKYSGRLIRQSIIDNDYAITSEIKKLLPKSTVEILEKELT